MAGKRRKARITALQALYEIDCVQHEARDVLAHLIVEKALSPEAMSFSEELVHGVLQNKSRIDDIIGQFARSFPVEQMPLIDRNILRLAIFEILFNNNTPIRVVIDEAVELAKTFGSDSSARLINGVLGSIASEHSARTSKT